MARTGGSLRALRNYNYRIYVGGQLVSLTGTWMQRVAQDWLVLELTGSGAALGITTAFQFGPSLFLGMWGGVLADRSDKRRLMTITQTALALIAAVLGVLTVAGVVHLWHVLVLALLLGVTTALDSPARQSFVVEMVGRDDLVSAVGINSMIFNIGRVFGPLLAGVTISAVGLGWAFLANAISSVAVVSALLAMRPGELRVSPALPSAPGQMRAGLAYVRSRTDLWAIVALMAAIGTFGYNFQFTTALLAKLTFHRDASAYGLMTAALAVGSIAGGVLVARRTRRPTVTGLFILAVLFSILEILCGLMPTYATALVLMVPTGTAMISLASGCNSAVQLGVDPTMRGRVVALYYVAFQGGTFLGGPIIGSTAQWLGPRWGLIGGGLACLVSIAVIVTVLCRSQGVGPRALARRMRALAQRRPRVVEV